MTAQARQRVRLGLSLVVLGLGMVAISVRRGSIDVVPDTLGFFLVALGGHRLRPFSPRALRVAATALVLAVLDAVTTGFSFWLDSTTVGASVEPVHPSLALSYLAAEWSVAFVLVIGAGLVLLTFLVHHSCVLGADVSEMDRAFRRVAVVAWIPFVLAHGVPYGALSLQVLSGSQAEWLAFARNGWPTVVGLLAVWALVLIILAIAERRTRQRQAL
jgi:hypothetical protein